MKEMVVKAHNAAAQNISQIVDRRLQGFGGLAAAQGHDKVESLGSLRRQTLVALRWGAVTGQVLAHLAIGRTALVNGRHHKSIFDSFLSPRRDRRDHSVALGCFGFGRHGADTFIWACFLSPSFALGSGRQF